MQKSWLYEDIKFKIAKIHKVLDLLINKTLIIFDKELPHIINRKPMTIIVFGVYFTVIFPFLVEHILRPQFKSVSAEIDSMKYFSDSATQRLTTPVDLSGSI